MTHKAGQPYHLHGIRVLLFGMLLAALLLVRVDSSLIAASAASPRVLAYSTNLNRTDLLNSTNAYRAQHGLPPLALNGALNTAAQNKAQHMIDYNYWAHVAPDGTQPWYFFDQAGYSYRSAGENLAYGFNTSAAIVDAWMNSPSHRDNILGNYAEIGFGYVNGASYQGGENTVVVAHYGTPLTASAPAPTPAPTPTTTTQPPAPPAPSPASPTTAPTPLAPVTSSPATSQDPGAPAEPTPSTSTTEVTTSDTTAPLPVAAGTAQVVSLLDRLRLPNPPVIALASITMTIVAATGFALTHRSLMRHAVASGERFVVAHPAFDLAAIAAISVLILTTTVSRIG